MMHRSTMKNFRNKDEIYYEPAFPFKERAQVDERKANREAGNVLVRKILAGPVVDALSEDVVKAINEILREADEG